MNNPIPWFDILLQIGPFVIKGLQWIRNRIKWRGVSEDARKIAFAIHSFSLTNLQQTAPIINRVGLISRPEIDYIQKTWISSDTPFILHGEAGTGKSGITLRLGQALTNDGTPVLFIKATDFPSGEDPVTIIQNRMALSVPLMDAIAKLCKERTCSVIVDQLDSVAGSDLGKNFVSFLKVLSGIPNVKVLAVSRTYELLNDQEISTLGFQKIDSGHLNEQQTLEYLSLLGLSAPPQLIVDLASNLLYLSLISDVVAFTPDRSNDIVSEVALWKQFLHSIEQREGNEAVEFILRLARDVTAKGERTFSVNFPSIGIRRKLLSRGILTHAPGLRFTFRHEQLQNFLCSYSLLPEQPTIVQLLNEFGNNVPEGVISWLHMLYHAENPDAESDYVDEVLGAREKFPFYSRIKVLENLKIQTDPSENVASVIAKYSDDWAYHRFFFEGLENLAWILPLYRTGFFHSAPEPFETQPGSYQLPGWPAGEYLVRFADEYEEIVIDLVQSIRTENWHVQEILIDAMLKISPATAAFLIPNMDVWLSGRFSGMLPNKLIALADHMLEAGFTSASIQILESVIKPILPKSADQFSKYRSEIRFRSDHYWVNEYCQKQLPKLMKSDALGIVTVFERQLMGAIELVKQVKPEDPEKWVGYYWRMDIPNRISATSDADVLDILIDGLRDGLADLCKQFIENGGGFLKTYLTSEHLILQRITLHTLRAYGQNYPELINQALLQRDFFENGKYANEYRGLLRDQFASASEEARKQVISWILAGPLDIDSRVARLAEWKKREITDEDRRKIYDRWTLSYLEIIRNCLTGEALTRLNELTAVYGKPDIEERPHIVTTSWGVAPSPVPTEELAKKSFDELKQLFLTFSPEDLFLNSRESLAQAFQGLVRENPTYYSNFATYLIDPAVRFVYIYHYLLGISESVKNKGSKLGDAIIGLCEFVVTQKEDPFENSSGRHEPDLITSQMEVARLLEAALQSDNTYLTREQLGRIRSLLVVLVNHSDPENEDDSSTSFNPFTHSLNCVRGVAMHGLLHYSLYLVRQQDELKGEKRKAGFLEKEIQEVLDEKLGLTIEPSLAVHSVYGAFVPQLHYMARGWLEEHLSSIFPKEAEKETYWKAAWDAYIFTSNVYRDVFTLLIPQYRRGIQFLSKTQEEQKQLGGSPNERLAQHIMFAYLAGLTDFGHQNSLLDLFFVNAPDPIRANGIFWLSQVLENEKPSVDDVLWKKCWALWQKRLTTVEGQEVSINSQEISEYMRWLKYCPVGLDVLYPTLQQTVKFLNDGFDAKELDSYAAKHCELFPFEAVTLLQQTILSAKEPWWAPKDGDEEKILRDALASGNVNAKQIALEVINYRGEVGDFRWKNLIT